MIHALDRLLSFFIITVLLFVIPTYYQYQRQEEMNYQLVLLETEKAAGLICELGYVEENSLSQLKAVLAATGNRYQIQLAHLQKKFIENEAAGKIEAYYEGNYNQQIYEEIAKEGRFRMDFGDYFYIYIENKGQTSFQRLKSVFGLPSQGVTIIARSGGLIRAEGL